MQEIELSNKVSELYRALIEDFDQRPEDNFTKEAQLEQVNNFNRTKYDGTPYRSRE